MRRRQRRLRRLLVRRQLAGIAARPRRILQRIGHDELGAQRLNLFAGCGAHVGGAHHGAEALGRRDRLQAGNAGAHHEHLGRTHRARRRHHHRHGAVESHRRIEHRLVAGQIGLARQDVHHLRARDARHEFHRHQRHAGPGQRVDVAFAAIRVHRADHQRARLGAGEDLDARPPHGQDDIGILHRLGSARRHQRAGFFVFRIGKTRCCTGTCLDGDDIAEPDQLTGSFRRRGHTGFPVGPLPDDSNLH